MNTVVAELLPLSAEDFAALEAWLSVRRTSFPETPDWEFCEGFMAAMVCCRQPIAPSEYWPRLLGLAADAVPGDVCDLWTRRWALVEQALDTRVSALDDPAGRAGAQRCLPLREWEEVQEVLRLSLGGISHRLDQDRTLRQPNQSEGAA
ncbi:MAG: YecA family protein [Hydrogenophaga sp.]|nr:YecA family protein [Hydrogenophaga sp.]